MSKPSGLPAAHRFFWKHGWKLHDWQEKGIQWMLEREKKNPELPRGGLLCDEMGLGKTIQTLGLLVAHPKPRTLIVLPPVLVEQWKKYLEIIVEKTDYHFQIFIYYISIFIY